MIIMPKLRPRNYVRELIISYFRLHVSLLVASMLTNILFPSFCIKSAKPLNTKFVCNTNLCATVQYSLYIIIPSNTTVKCRHNVQTHPMCFFLNSRYHQSYINTKMEY